MKISLSADMSMYFLAPWLVKPTSRVIHTQITFNIWQLRNVVWLMIKLVKQKNVDENWHYVKKIRLDYNLHHYSLLQFKWSKLHISFNFYEETGSSLPLTSSWTFSRAEFDCSCSLMTRNWFQYSTFVVLTAACMMRSILILSSYDLKESSRSFMALSSKIISLHLTMTYSIYPVIFSSKSYWHRSLIIRSVYFAWTIARRKMDIR